MKKAIGVSTVAVCLLVAVALLFRANITKQNLDSWLGSYYYFEGFPSTPEVPSYPTAATIGYDIVIYKNNNKYYAQVDNEGFQTRDYFIAKVVGTNEHIDLLFDSYNGDNEWGHYSPGELILSLFWKDGVLYTEWHKIRSETSYINEETVGLYYEKQS